MSRIRKLQNSFSSGELSPKLSGRTNLSKYESGLATLYNFLAVPYGMVTRRPGTRYIGPAIDNTNENRLLPFEFSNEQTYILEFGDHVIKFYTNQGTLLSDAAFVNGTFGSNITGWTERNAGTGAISHDAVNFRMNLTGGTGVNYARAYQQLVNLGISTYTVTLDVGTNTITYRVGTTIGGSNVTTGTLTTGVGKTFTFTCTTIDDVYVEFECANPAYVDNIVLSSPIYQIYSPYPIADISSLRFETSYDTIYIVHADYAPNSLLRVGAAEWTFETVSFDEPAYMDANTTDTTLTPSATSGSVTITASSATFATTDVGRAIRYKAGDDRSQVVVYTGTGSQTYFDIPFYPQTSADLTVNLINTDGSRTAWTYTAGAPGAAQYTITSGQVRTGSTPTSSQSLEIAPINVGSGEWGWATITAYTSTTQVTALVERTLGGTNASTEWRLGAWSSTTGYPSVIKLHEQRLWFANTSDQPSTFWASSTGDYTNFQPDNILFKGDIDDDTAFSFTLNGSGSQAIVWMASKGALLMGTSNAIFSVKGSGAATTSTNINTRKEADIPCAQLEHCETFNEVIFLDRFRSRIYSTFYSFDIDGYTVEELTLYSDHVGFESNFTQLIYQPSMRLIWGKREDGTLVAISYLRSQQSLGVSRHGLGGTDTVVKSLGAITGTAGSELWMIVSRTINGSTAHYIEMMEQPFEYTTINNAKFLDSHLSYSGASTATITGLTYLEGQTVSILANGSVHPTKTVSGGQITLDRSVTNATIGLGYSSQLESLDIEGGSVIGSNLGAISRILSVSLRFFETLGGKFGYDATNLETIYFRSSSDLMGQAPAMFTGVKTITYPNGYNNNYKVYIQQDQPLPMSILSMSYNAQVADIL